jgi:membrane fusion protein, multidrug efflux system
MKTNARQQLSHSDPSGGADEFDRAGAPGHGRFAGHEHARSETVARITPFTGHGGEPPAGGAAADWHAPSDATVDSSTGSTERRPMKTWIVLALALVAAGAVTWMMMREPSAPADAAATDTPKGPLELAAVDVATIESHVLTRLLPLSGSIAPFVQAMVKSKVAGEVEQVTVREGQDVQQGDVIARIDTRNLQAQYDRELAAVDKARADLDLAKLNRDKNRTLLEQRYISQNTYEATESAYAASVASFRLAEAQARLAKIELDDAVIRAPFAGTIATRLVQPGEKVSPDSAIVTLVDLRQMVLEAGVPAAEIPSVRVGQTARFAVGGFGEREFTGEVQRINPVTASGSRAITIYIAVANPDRVLKGGMFAQGQLTLDSTQPVLAVAQSAVRDEAGANYVYTLRDGKITRTPVRLGPSVKGAKYVEVREGLTAGDRVIVANLADGKAGAEAFVRGETDTAANARVER